jgi:hypothetical protein
VLLGTDLFRAGASGEPRRRRASRWRPADETFRRLGVLDELGLAVLPLLLGRGMQPAPSVGNDAALTLTGHRALPSSTVEITYACV